MAISTEKFENIKSKIQQFIDEEMIADENSFDLARQLIKKEGLLCGGSSGTVVWAALEAAKSLKKGQRCLCILADGIRNYMSKFVSDEWMEKNNFKN